MTATPTANGRAVSNGASAGLEHERREAPLPPTKPITSVRRQRRPGLIGFGVALIVLGALGASWLATSGNATHRVLAVARPVPLGAVIGDRDLVSVDAPA